MSDQQIYKEIIGDIIKKKHSFYGQVLITKISATGSVSISPTGEVVSINGDPKRALESVLAVFKEISGAVGLTSAVTALASYSMKNPQIKPEIDEVVNKFS